MEMIHFWQLKFYTIHTKNDLIKFFKNYNLNRLFETNHKIDIFVDFPLNLKTNLHYPFGKPNKILENLIDLSNHLRSTLDGMVTAISFRI